MDHNRPLVFQKTEPQTDAEAPGFLDGKLYSIRVNQR